MNHAFESTDGINSTCTDFAKAVEYAILSRASCRAFTPRSVHLDKVSAILETANRAPSGGNLQPWHVHVVSGEPLRRFRFVMSAKFRETPAGEGCEYELYPRDLSEPFLSRVEDSSEAIYAAVGISPAHRIKRLIQFGRNFDFFGAPIGMFVSTNKSMGRYQWTAIGMFIQNILLLAQEQGLGCCVQDTWGLWQDTVREFLSLPTDSTILCGIALGYKDHEAAENSLRTTRAPLNEFATFIKV